MESFSNCTFDFLKDGKVVDQVLTLGCAPIIFKNIVFILLLLAGFAALVFIIIGGFKYITSGGDPKQAEGGRKTLTWAIIGLILIFISFGILNFISSVTGTDCIQKFGFTSCQPPEEDLRSHPH